MEYIPDNFFTFFGQKTKREQQKEKCMKIIRTNKSGLNRQSSSCKEAENKARRAILEEHRRSQRSPSQAKVHQANIRILARSFINARKQTARVAAMMAQLNSIEMQINEAFAMAKIEKGLGVSASIMKDVNTLVKMPELTGTMRNLEQELMKADIIKEMTDDMLSSGPLMDVEEEETDAEIEKVLGEVIKTPRLPDAKVSEPVGFEPEPQHADQEASLEQMRGRLEALKS